MTADIKQFPSGTSYDGDGGGPEDPMLEQRVARLEEDVKEIRADVREINGRLNRMDERMGRMEVGIEKIAGRVDHLPTTYTLVVAVLASIFGAVATVLSVIAVFQP